MKIMQITLTVITDLLEIVGSIRLLCVYIQVTILEITKARISYSFNQQNLGIIEDDEMEEGESLATSEGIETCSCLSKMLRIILFL